MKVGSITQAVLSGDKVAHKLVLLAPCKEKGYDENGAVN